MPGGTIPGWVYGIVLPTLFQFRKIGISSCGNPSGWLPFRLPDARMLPNFRHWHDAWPGWSWGKEASLDSGVMSGWNDLGFVRLHRFRVAVWVAWSLANESLDSSPNATGSLDFSVIDTSVYQGFEFLPWGRMSKGCRAEESQEIWDRQTAGRHGLLEPQGLR